jgi:SpoVK/Ycf46/Vps4 family AAA+-type ATPase
MEIVQNLTLSVSTLLAVMLLPFLYFVIQARYGYYWVVRKRLETYLLVAACLVGAVIIWKATIQRPTSGFELQLLLLHLAGPILTLLICGQTSPERAAAKAAAHEAKKGENSLGFKPTRKEVDRITWDDIVIDDELKTEFMSVIELLKNPGEAHKYGIEVPKGILLNGPPGTGKTTIAKAIANTANLSFFALKMDEVVSKWVGESEKNLSQLFNVAQKYSPSVIFIDEIDSIGKERSGKGQQWSENLLNHLLQLIDGVVKTEGLYVIGATNRADLVDSALKRAGRLNKVIEIPAPDADGRFQLFQLNLAKLHLEECVNITELVDATDGWTGADIKAICNQAGLNAFKRESGEKKRSYAVSRKDLYAALNEFLQQKAAA